jgi:hypothetical protein
MTEGDRKFRAQIERNVKLRTKLHIGERVKVKENAKSGLHGQEGFVESVTSQTPITNVEQTKVMYLVRIDSTGLIYAFDFEELKVITTPEKVTFT